jgi:hypothetical protein
MKKQKYLTYCRDINPFIQTKALKGPELQQFKNANCVFYWFFIFKKLKTICCSFLLCSYMLYETTCSHSLATHTSYHHVNTTNQSNEIVLRN